MTRPAPQIWLNGRQLDTGAGASSLVLAPLTITWGSDAGEEQPDAANAKVRFLFLETMGDLPDLKKGAALEVVDPGTGHAVLAGSVTTMGAKPSTQRKGALEVEVNVADWLADLESEYVSPDWPSNTNRPSHLRAAFTDAGWNLQVPNDVQVSAAAKLNSVKLLTMLERHITRYRGRRYDTSYRQPDGTLLKRVSVYKGAARELAPDRLLTLTDGQWARQFAAASIDGVDLPTVEIPAGNILNDPAWSSGPEDATTAVKLSTMELGDDGFSTLVERNYKASPAVINTLGLRSIDLETDLADSGAWQPAAAAYFDDDAPWKLDALTVEDSDKFAPEIMDALLSPLTRYQLLVIITGINPNRPDPGPSDLRSFISGGEYTWTGKQWNITLTLSRTITKLSGEGDWWTCERVGASSDPDISNATCETVGDRLTVADFRFIGAP